MRVDTVDRAAGELGDIVDLAIIVVIFFISCVTVVGVCVIIIRVVNVALRRAEQTTLRCGSLPCGTMRCVGVFVARYSLYAHIQCGWHVVYTA